MTCYYKYSNTNGPVAHDYSFPCVPSDGQVVQCCDRGDVCMSNGLCQYGKSGPDKTFYVGGCTSSSFSGSACLNTCTNQNTSDITYNVTAQVWQCCRSAGNCANPAVEEILSAPPAGSLQSIATIATDGAVTPLSTTSTPATTTSSNGTPAAATTSAGQSSGTSSSGGLSTGATAGIAVGAVLVGLLLAAVAVFFWKRRGKRSQNAEMRGYMDQPVANGPSTGDSYYPPGKQYPMSSQEKDATAAGPPELPPMTSQLRAELPSTRDAQRAELPGSVVQRPAQPPQPSEVGIEH